MIGSIIGGLGAIGTRIAGLSASNAAAKRQEALAREQIAYQKELARNQIQWRVQDAKAAGLHPLAALGVSGSSYSPVSIGGASYDTSGLSQSLASMGQNIDRAVMAGKDKAAQRKAQDLADKQTGLALDHQSLTNDILRAELASKRMRLAADMVSSIRPMATPRGLPRSEYAVDGQVDGPLATRPDKYWDKGIRKFGFTVDPSGKRTDIVPSDDYKSRTEDVPIYELIPWLESMGRHIFGRFLGQEVDGYWWHGADKGYLPYPPDRKPRKQGYYIGQGMGFVGR